MNDVSQSSAALSRRSVFSFLRIGAPEPLVRLALLAALVVGGGSLAVAFILQFGFGVQPCILCLYERVPYALLAATGAVGLLFAGPATQRWLLGLCALILLAGAGLGGYHVGVEEHWWQAATGCAVTPAETLSIDQLQAALLTPLKPCDQVDFRVAGLSLAGINGLLSLALASLYAIVFWQLRRR